MTVGALGNLTQFAIIRKAHEIVAELSNLAKWVPIGSSIAKCGRYLSMTMTLVVLFSVWLIGSFALVVLELGREAHLGQKSKRWEQSLPYLNIFNRFAGVCRAKTSEMARTRILASAISRHAIILAKP